MEPDEGIQLSSNDASRVSYWYIPVFVCCYCCCYTEDSAEV